jgi:hypothetical protein
MSLDKLGWIETRTQEVRSRYEDELDQGIGGQTLGSFNIGCHREGFISYSDSMKRKASGFYRDPISTKAIIVIETSVPPDACR